MLIWLFGFGLYDLKSIFKRIAHPYRQLDKEDHDNFGILDDTYNLSTFKGRVYLLLTSWVLEIVIFFLLLGIAHVAGIGSELKGTLLLFLVVSCLADLNTDYYRVNYYLNGTKDYVGCYLGIIIGLFLCYLYGVLIYQVVTLAILN